MKSCSGPVDVYLIQHPQSQQQGANAHQGNPHLAAGGEPRHSMTQGLAEGSAQMQMARAGSLGMHPNAVQQKQQQVMHMAGHSPVVKSEAFAYGGGGGVGPAAMFAAADPSALPDLQSLQQLQQQQGLAGLPYLQAHPMQLQQQGLGTPAQQHATMAQRQYSGQLAMGGQQGTPALQAAAQLQQQALQLQHQAPAVVTMGLPGVAGQASALHNLPGGSQTLDLSTPSKAKGGAGLGALGGMGLPQGNMGGLPALEPVLTRPGGGAGRAAMHGLRAEHGAGPVAGGKAGAPGAVAGSGCESPIAMADLFGFLSSPGHPMALPGMGPGDASPGLLRSGLHSPVAGALGMGIKPFGLDPEEWFNSTGAGGPSFPTMAMAGPSAGGSMVAGPSQKGPPAGGQAGGLGMDPAPLATLFADDPSSLFFKDGDDSRL